jgi:hypothetical protein
MHGATMKLIDSAKMKLLRFFGVCSYSRMGEKIN